MRILYIPFFSNMNLAGCSIFNNMKVLLRNLVEMHEDVHVFYPYPDNEAFDVSAISYLEHPRIKLIPVEARKIQSEDNVFLPAAIMDLFNTCDGEYHVDLILSDKQRIAVWIELLLNDQIRAVPSGVPIVNFTQYPVNREGRLEHYGEAFEFAQVLGWYNGWNMWGSRVDYEDCLKAARKYASPRVVRRIMDRSFHDVQTVIACDRISGYSKEKPRDEIRINYASRFGTHYEFEELFEEVDLLYKAGRPVKLVVTSPSLVPGRVGSRVLNELEERKQSFEVHYRCPQEEFYGHASQCHVALWRIKQASAFLTLREQVFMGQAVVIPDGPTYREQLPDYPYMYRDTKEMRVMLRHVVDNYWSEEVQNVVAKYRQYVQDRYDVKGRMDALHAFFAERIRESEVHDASCTNMVREALELAGWPERMTYDELRDVLRKHTRIGKDIEVRYTGTARNNYRWIMADVGYRDTQEEFYPVYEKVKAPSE